MKNTAKWLFLYNTMLLKHSNVLVNIWSTKDKKLWPLFIVTLLALTYITIETVMTTDHYTRFIDGVNYNVIGITKYQYKYFNTYIMGIQYCDYLNRFECCCKISNYCCMIINCCYIAMKVSPMIQVPSTGD